MIYFIQDTSSRAIKIGTSKNPLSRLSDLQTAHHAPLILIGVMDGTQHEERLLHHKFERLQGEWFEPSRALLAYIQNSAITPQSMGHLPSTTLMMPASLTTAKLVDHLCMIRDVLFLVGLWVMTLVTTLYTAACLIMIVRDGDWSRTSWFFVGIIETLAMTAMSASYRTHLTRAARLERPVEGWRAASDREAA
jgi:hypothetical protein